MGGNSEYLLRSQPRINYNETEELDMDLYIFCLKCEDYVYAYCSVHGPLLVVPDDVVESPVSSVPRAALTIPSLCLYIAPSKIPGAHLGVFTKIALPIDVRFGPYEGKIAKQANSDYCWQILNKDRTPSHILDASDPNSSNWLRYVNCSRHYAEQNLVAFQHRRRIYYRTIKPIPPGTELLVFYGVEAAKKLGIDLRRYNCNTSYDAATVSSNKIKAHQDNNTCRELRPYQPISPAIEIAHQSTKYEEKHLEFNKKYDFKVIEDAKNDFTGNFGEIDIIFDDSNASYNDSVVSYCTTQSEESNKEKKNKRIHKCTECEYRSSFPEVLQKHAKLHDMTRAFGCNVCNYRFSERCKLENHLTTHKEHKCNICEDNFASARELLHHKSQHTVKQLYKCNICDFETKRSTSLRNHMKSSFSHGSFACQLCNYTTNGRLQYYAHNKTHNGAQECSLCNYKTTNGLSMAAHLEAHEKKYRCDECDYKCSYPHLLKNHRFYQHGKRNE